MARKKSSKSEASIAEQIRNAWDRDRSVKPAALVEALKAQGIATNAGTVATTLSQYRKKLGMAPLRGRIRRKAVSNVGRAGSGLQQGGENGRSVTAVIEALKLVTKAKELVGTDGLRELVKAI